MSSDSKKIEAIIKVIIPNPVRTCITDLFTYEIILRYPINNEYININAMLIKKGFAECTDVAIFHGENELKKDPFYKRNLPSVLETKAQAFVSNLCNRDLAPKRTPNNSIRCKVTNAVSPNEIWLQKLIYSVDHFEVFQRMLNEKYKGLKSSSKSWSINDMCVFRFSSVDCFRAKIIEKHANGKYNILCVDDGNYYFNVVDTKLYDLIDEYKYKVILNQKF